MSSGRSASDPPTPAAEGELARALTGTWRLLSWEAVGEDGTVERPFGDEPEGLLVYTAGGTMVTTIGRSGRPAIPAGDLLAGPADERLAAMASFIAYGGTYRTDGSDVVHGVTMSLFPNWTRHRAAPPRPPRGRRPASHPERRPPPGPWPRGRPAPHVGAHGVGRAPATGAAASGSATRRPTPPTDGRLWRAGATGSPSARRPRSNRPRRGPTDRRRAAWQPPLRLARAFCAPRYLWPDALARSSPVGLAAGWPIPVGECSRRLRQAEAAALNGSSANGVKRTWSGRNVRATRPS